MNRPDLGLTFTKIELWRQMQYSRIVYMDCDTVAIRAPDELLSLDVDHLAAAPDVGWPDCFNSGVMVLRPNLHDYEGLRAMAADGVSFDGADQGLLNMYFGDNWHRLSFTYNCTPSANYQYIPAYKHFEDSIKVIHFIGSQKPWDLPRNAFHFAETPYSRLLGSWWDVYDHHAAGKTVEPPELQWDASRYDCHPTHRGMFHADERREPPPAGSKPEAINLENKTYAMSQDLNLFQPSTDIPATESSEPQKLPQLFPWESRVPKPTRVFPGENVEHGQ